MFWRFSLFFILFPLFCGIPVLLSAQAETNDADAHAAIEKAMPLFHSDDILHLKLSGNLNELYKDVGDNGSYHPVLLQYTLADSSKFAIPISIKTRGHYRKLREVCKTPPLLLEFAADKVKNTLFDNQKKLKLIVTCTRDEYVISEYLAYKLYNLISGRSFRDRLAIVTFEDSAHRRKNETHYCFLLEDEKEMAARNGCFVIKKKMVDMRLTNLDEFRKMAMFQYLIGNTDWGVSFLQNIVLITKDSLMAPYTVPYDFDQAGIVGADYAVPHPELDIPSVRTRLYRGFCEKDLDNFSSTFALFNRLKPDIYKVYDSCSLLSSGYVKYVNRYLDEFYKTINSKRDIEEEFGNPCRLENRVEIKGLKK
ncbi:MAG: hypothetical protein ACRDE8_10315 [Ginsengibacter sp.]